MTFQGRFKRCMEQMRAVAVRLRQRGVEQPGVLSHRAQRRTAAEVFGIPQVGSDSGYRGVLIAPGEYRIASPTGTVPSLGASAEQTADEAVCEMNDDKEKPPRGAVFIRQVALSDNSNTTFRRDVFVLRDIVDFARPPQRPFARCVIGLEDDGGRSIDGLPPILPVFPYVIVMMPLAPTVTDLTYLEAMSVAAGRPASCVRCRQNCRWMPMSRRPRAWTRRRGSDLPSLSNVPCNPDMPASRSQPRMPMIATTIISSIR